MAVLHTLGELQFEGSSATGLSSPRIALTLLAYLASRSAKPVDRGHLADLFWRERDSGKARQSLRQVLLELKRMVGEGLVADHERIYLTSEAVELDSTRFERDVAAGRWLNAVGLWKGEFLAAADNLGGEDFRLWLEVERQRLHRGLRLAFTNLIEQARRDGDWRQGVAWAERWTELLPGDEEGQRHLIELTHLDGRTAEALARHSAITAQLRVTAGEPTASFIRLGKLLEGRLGSGSVRRTPGSAALFTPDLIGRGHALEELQMAWRGVRAGVPNAVLVEGEAGIGKSRLCAEFLRHLDESEGSRPTILRARGYETTPASALATLAELALTLAAAPGASGASAAALGELAQLAPGIRELFPSVQPSSTGGHGLEDALIEVLDAVATERPVVLYFDDLPLADLATQQVLLSVSGRVSSPVLFLVTGRTGDDRSSAYIELASRPGIRRIKLQPLSVWDIELLLGSMLELAPPDRHHLGQRLHAETGGNPFYAIELTAALVDEGLLSPTEGGAWHLEGAEAGRPIPLPATIREVVARRLERLSPDARLAVAGAAVLGRSFDPALVPTVAGMAPATWAAAQEELIARRIIRHSTSFSGWYEFSHELMHRVAYDLLPAGRREALHRAAAQVYKPRAHLHPADQTAFDYHRSQIRPRRQFRRRTLIATAAFVVVALIAAGLMWRRPHWDLQLVQVTPFQNQTGDSALDGLGRMASDWINLGLVQTRLVTIVPTETSGPEARRGSTPAPATIVRGRFYADRDSLLFRAEALDARSNRVLFTLEPVASARRAPMEAIERVRQKVTALLATHLNPRLRDWTSAGSKPTTFEAYQEYATGVELFLQLEYRAAIVHYARAARLDPAFTLAQLDAAIAYLNLGELHEADSIGQLVGRRAERLAPFDRYWLRWMQAYLRGDRVAALEAVRQAASLTEGSEAWYQVGYEARALNRTREAVKALRRLDPAKAGEQGWYPYWDQLTTAYHLRGDHRDELKAARAGRRQYPDIIPTLSYEVRALAALGLMDDVRERLDQGLSMPSYDRRNVATLLRTAAEELEAHGHPNEARQARRQGISWIQSRSIDERSSEINRLALAQLFYLDGRLPEAGALFRALAAEHPEDVRYAGYLGVLASRSGDRAGAERIEEWLSTVNQPYLFGLPHFWQARIAARLGRADEAVNYLGQAFAEGGQFDLWLHTDSDLESLRPLSRFQALLEPKD